MYQIFKRKVWKKNPSWPEGYEPDGAARKTNVRRVETEAQAREICQEANLGRPTSGKGKYEFVWTEYYSD